MNHTAVSQYVDQRGELRAMPGGYGGKRILVWTQDAYFCHRTNQDCANCPIMASYGLDKCLMPKTVKALVRRQVPIPKHYLESPRLKQGFDYHFATQGSLKIHSSTQLITD